MLLQIHGDLVLGDRPAKEVCPYREPGQDDDDDDRYPQRMAPPFLVVVMVLGLVMLRLVMLRLMVLGLVMLGLMMLGLMVLLVLVTVTVSLVSGHDGHSPHDSPSFAPPLLTDRIPGQRVALPDMRVPRTRETIAPWSW